MKRLWTGLAGAAAAAVLVTAVADEKKGERLVVVHVAINHDPEALCKGLQQAGLPPIWIPAQDSFCQVDKLPVLGSGKLDLKQIKKIAEDRFGRR